MYRIVHPPGRSGILPYRDGKLSLARRARCIGSLADFLEHYI
jgi:hypothetical protein